MQQFGFGARCPASGAARPCSRVRYARLRMICRLCISAAVCSIRNNGTRNAGMSSSGRVAIGAVLISPGAPVLSAALKVPMLRATTRSSMPLLVVRDLLYGKRTYGELANSPERIPTNHPGGSSQAPGRCRHHCQHPVSATSDALRLYPYPEGQRSRRCVARVRALGQAAHTGYGGIGRGASTRRVGSVGGELTAHAHEARRMRRRSGRGGSGEEPSWR